MIADLILVAVIVAISCALLGNFLVLRGITMLSDAITHSILLGIVLAYWQIQDLNSPLLIVGATLSGVAVTWVIEGLQRTGLMREDSAIGVTFPLFFSIAIILITRYASDIHLDVDAVLMGELAFAPFNRLNINGTDMGPKSFWVMLVIFIIDVIFVGFFYKELKLSTFDPEYARSIGISTVLMQYALMTLVSLTAVGAYDAVGSVLVVGYMVGPGLTAYLLTNRLSHMIGISMIVAAFNSVVGVYLAIYFDVSFAGMIAIVTGITTLLAVLFSPSKGFIRSGMMKLKKA